MKVVFLLCICTFFVKVSSERNNVCSNYLDYFFIDISDKCFYDEYIFAEQEPILKGIFPNYETHQVTTEDGYILTMYRLPKENPKGVIILQHPITSDSVVYYMQGNESTALLFYNAGYEIWLPNNRGTPSSQQHVNMSVNEYKYWDFGFHEIGIYDYSAIITYIANETQRNDITFIGHSMATTSSIVYASMKPDEAKKYIKIFIEMSPIAYFYNLASPLKLNCPVIDLIDELCKIMQWGSIMGKNNIFTKIGNSGAYPWNPFKELYVLLLNFAFGFVPDAIDPLIVNRVLSDMPKDSSMKALIHYGQICQNGGTFRMYDYKERNQQLYNSSTPPEYPLENIKVPMYLLTGDTDLCATVKDCEYLYAKLPQEVTMYGNYTAPNINHISLHTSIYRFSLYEHIIDFLSTLY